METVRVVLPALIRRALQAHLERLRVADLEKRDRRGYESKPQQVEEYGRWEDTVNWPED